MKETSKRLIGGILLTLAVLLLAVLCAVSCHTNGGNEETTLPDTIPVVPDDSGSATSDTEAVTDPATETDTEQDTTPRPSAVVFPGTGTPDYTRYITATRIHDVLAGNDALVIGLKAAKGYRRRSPVRSAKRCWYMITSWSCSLTAARRWIHTMTSTRWRQCICT